MKQLSKTNTIPGTIDYKKFLQEIKFLIIEKRNNALKSVNTGVITGSVITGSE